MHCTVPLIRGSSAFCRLDPEALPLAASSPVASCNLNARVECLAELDPEAVPLAANTACRFGDTAAELLEALGEEGFRDVAREDVMVS